MAVQRDERIYVQVCRRLPEESDREVANLLEIKDHYPKYVVTLDELAAGNVNGVKLVHLADFLLSDTYWSKSVIQCWKKGGYDQTGRFPHLLRGNLQKRQALDWQAGGGTLYPLWCMGLCVFLLWSPAHHRGQLYCGGHRPLYWGQETGYGLKLPPKTAQSPFISAYKPQKYMQKKPIGAIQSAFSISEKSTAPFT